MFCCCAQDASDGAATKGDDIEVHHDPLYEHSQPPVFEPEPTPEEAPEPEPPAKALEPNVPVWQPKNQQHLEQFEVVINLAQGQDIGITFLSKSVVRFPVVEEVQAGGPMEKWNKDNGMQVKPSTYIIAANGKTAPDDILQLCEQPGQLKLWMERKKQYTIDMPQKKQVLGLDMDRKSTTVLQLTAPSPERPVANIGLYGWNQVCEAGDEIRPGDKIVSAGGVTDASRILQTIKETSATSPLVMIMSRGD